MIVDFVFGGNDYVTRSLDVQKQVGPHSIQFAFEFNGKVHHFSRETVDHTYVTRCDDNYNPISDMTIADYRNSYLTITRLIALISFRDIVGRYFRIYGRENLEERALHSVRQETDKDAIGFA